MTGVVRAIYNTSGVAMDLVAPKDNVRLHIELLSEVAMEPGLRFSVREGGRTIGAGVVTKILDKIEAASK